MEKVKRSIDVLGLKEQAHSMPKANGTQLYEHVLRTNSDSVVREALRLVMKGTR